MYSERGKIRINHAHVNRPILSLLPFPLNIYHLWKHFLNRFHSSDFILFLSLSCLLLYFANKDMPHLCLLESFDALGRKSTNNGVFPNRRRILQRKSDLRGSESDTTNSTRNIEKKEAREAERTQKDRIEMDRIGQQREEMRSGQKWTGIRLTYLLLLLFMLYSS